MDSSVNLRFTRQEFHVIWSALTQFLENQGEEENEETKVAEELVAKFDTIMTQET